MGRILTVIIQMYFEVAILSFLDGTFPQGHEVLLSVVEYGLS